MTFYVGQKVCCIDNSLTTGIWCGDIPKVGTIYTVRGIEECIFTHVGQAGLILEEIVNAYNAPYFAERFRPLVERETDISIFTKMLIPNKQKELT